MSGSIEQPNIGPSYSSILQSNIVTEETPLSKVFDLGQSGDNYEKDDSQKSLFMLDDDELPALENQIRKAFDKKRGIEASKASDLRPGISVSANTVYLPDTIDKYDGNHLVAMMFILARKLHFNVRKIPYGDRRIKTITPEAEKVSAGISFVILDNERNFNITKKTDSYEQGRTYARAQQIIGMFTHDNNLTMDALKRDQYFFGNNPKEVEVINKRPYPVAYSAKEVRDLFIEEEWSPQLRDILNTLLRRSHILLNEDVATKAKIDNILPYSEAVSLFGMREVVTSQAVGKKPAITKKRVPKKPKANSLLLKTEMSFLDDLTSDLFKAVDVTSKKEWLEAVTKASWAVTKSKIVQKASHRTEYLQKFAAMTTNRLNELRAELEPAKNKRKADITQTEVNAMLLRRSDLIRNFVNEVTHLDPLLHTFMSSHAVTMEQDGKTMVDWPSTRLYLEKLVVDSGVYTELKSQERISAKPTQTPLTFTFNQQPAIVAEIKALEQKEGEKSPLVLTLRNLLRLGYLKTTDAVAAVTRTVGHETNKTSFDILDDGEQKDSIVAGLKKAGLLPKEVAAKTLFK
jgi:hypothetical protein